jgi:hypothetical protein
MTEKEGKETTDEVIRSIASVGRALLVEYIEGVTLLDLLPEEIPHVFSEVEGSSWLIQMGRIIAFDIAMNNFDRFPVVWSNKGSVFSFLVSKWNPSLKGGGFFL